MTPGSSLMPVRPPSAGWPGVAGTRARKRGSVLIIVMWVAFGLVSIALYFAHSMTFALRSSDNRVAGLEAEQAIAGAARYVSYLLANLEEPGKLPDVLTYANEAVPVGDATFWFIGRTDLETATETPVFGLVDEASKLNLNTATQAMLEGLPRMTPELAAAIVDWRDANSDVSPDGAEAETYLRRKPSYTCKNAPFETVAELRLVMGADLEILYGEDANMNGILDANENDGTVSPPIDNRDGRLDPGILEFVTVSSREPNVRSDGSPRLNLSGAGQQQLRTLLQEKFTADRANQIMSAFGGGPGNLRSTLEFYIRSRMTTDEFGQIAGDITVTNSPFSEGLINVNTASAEVLACIPGMDSAKAASMVSYRQSNPDKLTSVAWVSEVLDRDSALQAGPFLTAHSYQFTADVAAVGHHGRGYHRTRFVFDITETTPKVLFRQDLSALGWALGQDARQTMLLANQTR